MIKGRLGIKPTYFYKRGDQAECCDQNYQVVIKVPPNSM